MLQQILRDLYVDPEILAELDDQQKQTLFCKMREEQVRRWKIWDDKHPIQNHTKNNVGKKNVNFLKGIDGEPWVWVMGEHKDDKTIEDILKEEAIEKARKIAEKEAEQLRRRLEDYIDLTPKIETHEDIYCSVEELKLPQKNDYMNLTTKDFTNYHEEKMTDDLKSRNRRNVVETKDVLQEISLNRQKVAQRVALWEKKLTERTCEIFQKMQKQQLEEAREAEEQEKRSELLWQEQERKAKQAEQQIREIARRARHEHKLAAAVSASSPTTTTTECPYASAVVAGVPPNKQAVLDWYKSKEWPRGAGLDAAWFHGLVTRSEAEAALREAEEGSFLVRLSERVWGYAISYRARDKCKHYLVGAGVRYAFVGGGQVEHETLADLIAYHSQHPLTGGEKLQHAAPCGPTGPVLNLPDQL